MLLSVWYKLTKPSFMVGRILNILFSLSIVLLVYVYGRRAVNSLVGRWAALLWAVIPMTVIHSATVLCEQVLALILLKWLDRLGVKALFTESVGPWVNGYVE